VAALWLIAIILFVVSVFYSHAAFQLWHGNLDFRNTGQVATVADVPESRLRVYAASPAMAIAMSSVSAGAILVALADAVGGSTLGRFILVVGTCGGLAFFVFVAVAISIYLTNLPSRFVPPALRDRHLPR
jgi:hypothetical protein